MSELPTLGEHLLRGFFERADIGMLVLRPSPFGLAVLDANVASTEMLALTAGELRGRPLAAVFPAKAGPSLSTAGARLISGQFQEWRADIETPGRGPTQIVLSALANAGEEELFLAQLLPLPLAAHHVLDPPPAGRECVVAADLFEGILLATPGASIIATDAEGTIVFVNRGAIEMLDYAAEELLGRTPAQFHDIEERQRQSGEPIPDTRAEVVDALRAVLDGTPAGQCRDWTYDGKDGARLTVSLRVTTITDPSGAILGYVGMADDVTEQRWAQRLLEDGLVKEAEAVRRLHAVNRAKNEFIATVGHELRTPLASVRGYTELLMEGEGGPLTADQAKLLSRVEANALRLGNLVEELLTVARVGCESFTVGDEQVNLNVVVGRALTAVFSPLERPELRVDVLLDPTTPMLSGSAQELEQLVVHLLTNAATYTPDGGRIDVSTHCTGSHAFVVVADTGVGIPESEQDLVFSPFFRSSFSHNGAIQGSGLGLSIAEAIASAHGGELSVGSREGPGTVFTLQLPSAPRAAESASPPTSPVVSLDVPDDRERSAPRARVGAATGGTPTSSSSAVMGSRRFQRVGS